MYKLYLSVHVLAKNVCRFNLYQLVKKNASLTYSNQSNFIGLVNIYGYL